MKYVVTLVLLGCAADGLAATAAGRNWQLAIDGIACGAEGLTISTRMRYVGPKGPVESPVIRIVDGTGAAHQPKTMRWKGAKPIADWLSGGGLINLQAEDVGEVQLRFALPEQPGQLRFEFGDIPAFALSRGARSGCADTLRADQLNLPRVPPKAPGKPAMTVYRARYPCAADKALRTVDADYPPYLPRQLLVFGHGHLPSLREVKLPMGTAAAQAYAYSGVDEMAAVENAARQAIAADFPAYRPAAHFAFNWGLQPAASGNALYSVGIYELRACP